MKVPVTGLAVTFGEVGVKLGNIAKAKEGT